MISDRYTRQSFLGPDSESEVANCTIGIVGLGGGGSHIVQQLAHIGFQRYILYDDDVVEELNLNRQIGATPTDVLAGTSKLHLAKMIIYGLQPKARIEAYPCKWQERPGPLQKCQIVIGCLDSFQGREELEVACRRYLMHYIDIGMDVHGKEPPVIGGQVVLSSPGGLCMRCVGFLSDEKLAEEGRKYGGAGGRPQVVWPNGVLASTAVGLAVDLVTNWTRSARTHAYLSYDGNLGTIRNSPFLKNLDGWACPHYGVGHVGDPVLIGL